MRLKSKKAILLLEVVFVTLLVSIISLFLFRGYSLFIKAEKKGMNYLRLLLLGQEKIWDLQVKEKRFEISDSMEKEGSFTLPLFKWNLNLEDTYFSNLKKCTLKIKSEKDKQKPLDLVIYLNAELNE